MVTVGTRRGRRREPVPVIAYQKFMLNLGATEVAIDAALRAAPARPVETK